MIILNSKKKKEEELRELWQFVLHTKWKIWNESVEHF